MNNLHRELAPISDQAWAQIEEEATRTLKRHLAARRVVDVSGPQGFDLAAIGTGHTRQIQAPGDGIQALQREAKPLVELRVPFELTRQAVDDVDRGGPVQHIRTALELLDQRPAHLTADNGVRPFKSSTKTRFGFDQ